MFKTTLSLVIILALYSFSSEAQYQKEEQTQSFSSRINNPIQIEVIKKPDEVQFFVKNDSYFPYQVEVNFTSLINLHTPPESGKAVVMPGRHRLFSLGIRDKTQQHNYSYKYKFSIGDPNEQPDAEFPYLIPFAKGKPIETRGFAFKTNPGDTIYAMRKGLVTCLPDNNVETDRIFKNSLEVYHADGTVAVYQNIDPNSVFVNYGRKVYPGQPIGLAGNVNTLVMRVYRLMAGTIIPFRPMHVISETETKTVDNLGSVVSVDHPAGIIKRELTKGELKRLNKGTLYKNLEQDKTE